jgi:hypothetical protein
MRAPSNRVSNHTRKWESQGDFDAMAYRRWPAVDRHETDVLKINALAAPASADVIAVPLAPVVTLSERRFRLSNSASLHNNTVAQIGIHLSRPSPTILTSNVKRKGTT